MYKASVVGVDEERTTLEITVDEARVHEAVARAVRKIAARVAVPGFRRGKAPRAVLERIVSREAIYDEAIGDFAPEAYSAALRETGLEPLDDPEFDGLDDAQLDDAEPIVFRAKFTAKPPVKLGDYTAVKLDRQQREVTDEDVDRAIESLREQRSEYVPAERATAEAGDLATVDVVGYIDGEPDEAYSSHDLQIVVGSGELIPGLDDKIAGLSVNEPHEIVVNMPGAGGVSEDGSESASEGASQGVQPEGRSVTFKVSVKDVKVKQVPELDDDFAKDIGGVDTLAALRDRVMHSLRHRALEEAVGDLARRALASVVTTSEVEIPKLLIEREVADEMQSLQNRVLRQGLEWDQYLKARGKSEDEIRGEIRDVVPGTVKTRLVAEALAKKEGLMPTSDDVTMAAFRMAFDAVGNDKPKLQKLVLDPAVREAATEALIDAGVMQFLGRTCDADPASAKCDECEHDADEPQAHDSRGEAQE